MAFQLAQGTLHRSGKLVYDGQWYNGYYAGQGKLYGDDGALLAEGCFERGEFVESSSQYKNWAMDTTKLEDAAVKRLKTGKELVKFENREIIPRRACGPSWFKKMRDQSSAGDLQRVGRVTKKLVDLGKDRFVYQCAAAFEKEHMDFFLKNFKLPGAADYSTRHYFRDLCIWLGLTPHLPTLKGRLGYDDKSMSAQGYGDILKEYGEEASSDAGALVQAMCKVEPTCESMNFWGITLNDCEAGNVIKLFKVWHHSRT